MESERPIEKLLRACALKRRQADLPSEMHPVTRKLLQGEVSRQFGQARPKPAANWWSFPAIWPKLAWAGAAAAVVVTVLLVSMPGGKKTNAPELLARNDRLEAPTSTLENAPALAAADRDALAPVADAQKKLEVAQASRAISSSSGEEAKAKEQPAPASPPALLAQQYQYAKDKAALDAELAKNRELSLAANQPSPTSRAVGGPAGVSGGVAGTALAEPSARNYGVPMKAAAPAAAPMPVAVPGQLQPAIPTEIGFAPTMTQPTARAATPEVFFADEARRVGTLEQEPAFRRTDARVGLRSQTSGPQNAVLVSFRVQPTDNGVRIIDADGSVYSGSLQPTAAPAPTSTAPTARVSGRQLSRPAPASAPQVLADTKYSYAFHVSGTNKTLNQKVDFTGQLRLLTNALVLGTAYSAAKDSTPLDVTTDAPARWLLLNSEISGKALINGRQQVDVKAAPVKP